MDLKNKLISGMKKEDVNLLVKEILMSDDLFVEMVGFAASSNRIHAMKASWVIGHAAEMDNRMASEFLDQWIQIIEQTRIGGVQREMVKIISHCILPEEIEGWFLDKCFMIIQSAASDQAAKHHALTYAMAQTKRFPELKEELATILDAQITWHTPAWQRYVTKLIAKLRTQSKGGRQLKN